MASLQSEWQEFSGGPVRWGAAPEIQLLPFSVGGRPLTAFPLRVFSVATPFTKLSTDLAATLPPWRPLPKEVDAAVVPAQPIEAPLPRLVLLKDWVRYVVGYSDRYLVNLQGSFAAYMQKFSSKSRSELRRTLKRFAEHSGGQVQWREFRVPADMFEFQRLAVEISGKSWKVKSGGPGFPRSPEFAGKLAKAAAEESVRGYVLFHGERPVTYIQYRVEEDDLVGMHVAYDSEYSWWSPGNVLFLSIVEKLFAEKRFQYLDFGDGMLSYKRFFSTNAVRCARIFYFRRNLRNLSLASTHCGLTMASVGVGKVMLKAGLKQNIKRLLMGKLYRPSLET